MLICIAFLLTVHRFVIYGYEGLLGRTYMFPRRLKLGSLPVWNLGETEYTIEDCIMVPRCKGIHKTHSMLETPSSSTALEMMRCTSPVTECSTIEDSLCATQGSTAPVTKENSPTAGCSRNEALPRTPKTSKAFRRRLFGKRKALCASISFKLDLDN
ncbi:hypothetical protein JTB14_036334 [Gonioctena quinquepunctata]|nr:hypothetical protein JTB14_036334 [Gonioctena quinquepunctata]